MNIAKFLEAVKDSDPKTEIILASDAEGNDFHLLDNVEVADNVIYLWPEH
jgi:hypothetical protein